MIYVRTDDEVHAVLEVAIDPPLDADLHGWEGPWSWKSWEEIVDIAEEASVVSGEDLIPIDNGPNTSPRFEIIKAPKVGDKVSMTLNGDYYPCGIIGKVSQSLKVVTTFENGIFRKFYRKGKSGVWKFEKHWGLVPGHIYSRNPEV